VSAWTPIRCPRPYTLCPAKNPREKRASFGKRFSINIRYDSFFATVVVIK
jgi:hypothetical protein